MTTLHSDEEILEARSRLPEPSRFKGPFVEVETSLKQLRFHYDTTLETKKENSILFRKALAYTELGSLYWVWICTENDTIYM